MVPHFPLGENTPRIKTIAVAINKSKNSPHAVRWAIDHLVITNPSIILVHVRHKSTAPYSSSDAELDGSDTNELFVPYRAYCARKAIQLKEVVLDDNDVQKALLDFIRQSRLSSIVVGASTKNALARKLKGHDIPGGLMKSAPSFCSVHVISKGKLLTARTALRPLANTANPPKQLSPPGLPRTPDRSPEENGARYARAAWKSGEIEKWQVERSHDPTRAPERERARSSPTDLAMENIELSSCASSSVCSDSPFDDDDHQAELMFGSVDMSGQILDFGSIPTSPRESSVRYSERELEAEMRRLKLELKQTMEMYSSACKEAISAKNEARELHQRKLEENRKFEEARLAEEAALAIAELEKAKCKAALEAAEAAQKLAESEAQKRKEAEMKARREEEEKNRALSALAKTDIRYRKCTIEGIQVLDNIATNEVFSEDLASTMEEEDEEDEEDCLQ